MKINHPVTNVEREFGVEANILSTTDLKGAFTYANGDFERISGFTLGELKGKNHNVVRHPDMPPAAFEALWRTVKAGSSWMGIVKNRCKNGDHYWVDAYVTPIRHGGQVAEYQSVRNKPRREDVARAEALYRQINAGKTPRALRGGLAMRHRVTLGALAGVAAVAVAAVVAGLPPLAGGVAFAVGALVAAVAVQGLMRPLSRAAAEARAVVDDPLARYVYTGRGDEVGQLLLAFKMLRSEAGALVGRISDTSHALTGNAEQLAATVELSNQGTRQQHAETDQVATAVNQMTASIQEVATNARLTSEAADAASGEAAAGKAVVGRTTDSIRRLAGEVERAAGVIQRLEGDSAAISSVLDVISGIAEQTNLLALNAAIEAARAGDQGRGFAVVADEVRTLATRTHDSTEEIQTMIERLQGAAREAVAVMGAGRAQADESVARASDAAASLDAITDAVARITEMSAQIAVAVNEQSTVAEEVNRSITTIRDLSELTVDNTGKSEEASVAMGHVSHRLRELADQFWARRTG
ncbi:methyl-accepting chemotaxis protein [Endothiovibrio diazotrophicus]